MKNFFVKFLAVVGGMAILMSITIIIIGAIGFSVWRSKETVNEKTILELDLKKSLVEYVPDDPAALVMSEEHLKVFEIVEALERASEDSRVKGLVCRIGKAEMGLAQIQEIRNAVLEFRKQGKIAIAYTDTFGEFGPGNGAYYLATAFEEIYLQPSGDVGLTGLMIETGFLKGTLDKLAITPRMDHRYEYKNAMNTFTEEKYTFSHKEALQKVMDSFFGQLVKEISKTRKLSEEEIRFLIDKGPLLGKEAKDEKLVDGLAYRDEVYEKIKEEIGDDVEFLYLSKYLKRAGHLYTKGDTVALIYGVGAIQRGENEYNPISGGMVMGSETITAAFRAAIKDESVKAILFRIDSPGGSYVASDSIWREVVRAKEANKPVIVSMGNMAGSGGYFIAMAADKIVAQPGTITGSVGVFAGKMLTSDFWKKFGVSWDEIHTSKNATMWTGTQDYTPSQWRRVQEALDRIYEDFTDKVAQGRALSKESVLKIAKGRIWSGEDAKEIGLVDELGGFSTAIQLVKEAAGIPKDASISLKRFPLKKALPDILLEKIPDNSEAASVVTMARLLKKFHPIAQWMKQVGIINESGVLSVPEEISEVK